MFIHDLFAFLAIINPFSTLPIFLAMTPTNEYDDRERKRIATKAVIAAFIITTVFLFLGHYIMLMFGITLNAFQIAGGIIIFGIGIGLLHPHQSAYLNQDEQQEGVSKHDISITPLAMPLISGPGTITTVMTLATTQSGISSLFIELASYTIIMIVLWIALRYSEKLFGLLGHTGVGALTRIMGLILSIIAVQMVISGVTPLIHGV